MEEIINDGGSVGPPFPSIFKHLIAELISYYGEDRVDYSATTSATNLDIKVHFPFFYITNGTHQHPIYDLYVWIQNDSIRYIRSTYSILDLQNGYTHSHVPSMEKCLPSSLQKSSSRRQLLMQINTAKEVCTGHSTPLSLVRGILNQAISEETEITPFDAIHIVQAIDTAVHWESLDGGPYMALQRLNPIIAGVDRLPLKVPCPIVTTINNTVGTTITRYQKQNGTIVPTTLTIHTEKLMWLIADKILTQLDPNLIGYTVYHTNRNQQTEYLSDFRIAFDQLNLNKLILEILVELGLEEFAKLLLVGPDGYYPKVNPPSRGLIEYNILNNLKHYVLTFKGKLVPLKVIHHISNDPVTTPRNESTVDATIYPVMQISPIFINYIKTCLLYLVSYEPDN